MGFEDVAFLVVWDGRLLYGIYGCGICLILRLLL